jgi:hypothetical protein
MNSFTLTAIPLFILMADLHVHELHRRACLAETRRGAGRTRRALAWGRSRRRLASTCSSFKASGPAS